MNKKFIFQSFALIIFSILLFSFQEKQTESLSSEEAIEIKVLERIAQFKSKQHWKCQEQALRTAIPVADSMIAEMYARDLRANDILLERPDRPDRPQVEIEPFPFDSIE